MASLVSQRPCHAALFAAFALCLSAIAGAATGRPADAIIYRVNPEMHGGAMTALDVEMDFQAGAGATTRLDLPDQGEGVRWWPNIADLTVTGAKVQASGQAWRLLSHQSDARISVRYRVLPGSEDDPASQPFAPAIGPQRFSVHGETAFVIPENRDRSPAQVIFIGTPAGWTVGTDLDGAPTVGELRDGLMAGGAGYQLAVREVDGAPLRLLYAPSFADQAGPMLDQIVRVDRVERAFWNEPAHPFFVSLYASAGDHAVEGRGLYRGFALFLGPEVPRDSWLHLFAHEHMHAWISRRIGGFPETNDNLEAWLNEGFTEAYSARLLLRSGLWSPEQFLADQNAALVEYGASPVKTAPNSQIQAERRTDFDIGQLPYYRGRLLALVWNHRLRRETGGRIGLDDVLLAQEGQADRNARAGVKLSADKLFPKMVRRVSGIDLDDDIARYVDRGEAITLPSDLFGGCVQVIQASQPEFDRGFDIFATLKAGRLTGLEPGGPADRAGLRTGDKLVIDESPSRNSQKALTYKVVAADGTERPVRYLPVGKGSVSFQRLALDPNLTPAERLQCRRTMAND
ncbi:MAG TPA: hypothetical protein VII42_03305 [Caulobacteraceae bacterium]